MAENERENGSFVPNTISQALGNTALLRPIATTVCVVSALGGCGFRSGLDGYDTEVIGSDSWRDTGASSSVTSGSFGSSSATSSSFGSSSATSSSFGSGGASPNSVGTGGKAHYASTWSSGNAIGGNTRSWSDSTNRGGRTSYGGTSARRSSTAWGGSDPRGGSSSAGGFGGAQAMGGASWGGSQPGVGGTNPIDPLCPASRYVPLGCRDDVVEGALALCNDLDDDCDGSVDEGCACTPGAVKTCFAGPPSRRNVGACRDGLQTCEGRGSLGRWGACLGGITPQTEVCDTLDNDCDGCRDEIAGCKPVGSCPASGDSRIPVLRPFDRHSLNVNDFYDGDALSYSWGVDGGPCDRVAPTGIKSYDLIGASSKTAEFVPRLSGDYTVSLTVEALSGELFQCNWVVPVRGPGLRVEMCYPESDSQDLDLYLKRLSTQTPWFNSHDVSDPNQDECSWNNCEANLRNGVGGQRVDWGYEPSDLNECLGGPQGDRWQNLGYCANPRLDIDNNLHEGSGLPENINLDRPHDGDGFRIMVQNFSGDLAHPIVNVYCGGVRTATFGAPPDTLPAFSGPRAGHFTVGAMWRVADVLVRVADDGSVSCAVEALYSESGGSGYYVTNDDTSF